MSAGRPLKLHFDGGSRGNPGPAAVGICLVDAETDQPVHEAGYFLGEMTNNAAEYEALLKGLALAETWQPRHLAIFSDSQLLVRQINGQYRVKSAGLKPLFEQAQQQLAHFESWSIDHVKRALNERADALANAAMDAGQAVIEVDQQPPRSEPTEGASDAGGAFNSPQMDQAHDPGPPCWTVQLADEPTCPLGTPSGEVFTFGPTTPAGLCVHAAAAGLAAGPLHWPRKQTTGRTQCAHCRARLELTRIDAGER
jgi:ribonuclease HI